MDEVRERGENDGYPRRGSHRRSLQIEDVAVCIAIDTVQKTLGREPSKITGKETSGPRYVPSEECCSTVSAWEAGQVSCCSEAIHCKTLSICVGSPSAAVVREPEPETYHAPVRCSL